MRFGLKIESGLVVTDIHGVQSQTVGGFQKPATQSKDVSDHLTSEPRREYRRRDTGDGGYAASDPSRDLEAFAQWFADWWYRRGRHLTDPNRSDINEPTGTDNIDVRD
jgi:hypothetical protein